MSDASTDSGRPGPQITVRGSHTAYRQPERGTVHVRIGLEGPAADSVHAATSRSAGALGETLGPLHDAQAGPVTWWSSDQLHTWAQRPWNTEGKQLPIVHHAQVDLRAKFADFTALSRWVTQALAVAGVTVQRIEWALTEASRRELVGQVRTAAVRDACSKAQAYADALDLGPVKIREIADAGMLGRGVEPVGGEARFARLSAGGGGGDLAFTPEDVAISTEVDAVFSVS